MNKNFYTFIALFISVLFLNPIMGQISQGGTPPSFEEENLRSEVKHLVFENTRNMDDVALEDDMRAEEGLVYRAAIPVEMNISMVKEGTWETLSNGDQLCRLKISSPGALAIALYYDNFWLPAESRLFVYSADQFQLIGAFTQENNTADGLFVTELIKGDELILEYTAPAYVTKKPVIHISELAYGYRDMNFLFEAPKPDRDGSLWCMININCPEGDDWQDEKKGVVRQWMKIPGGYAWCSGSVINNTNMDLTPYVLTAHHCGEGCTQSDFNQWIFLFHYEASDCYGTTGPETSSMSGCELRASGDRYVGSDFMLLELNNSIPGSYNAYYNGWNRSNNASPSGVSIHHPAGDIKKVSTYSSALGSSQWNGNGVLSHWKATWAPTVNGTSITEGGSSGSPLFDNQGRIVGDLGGGPGSSGCDNPMYSLYGKVYWSWDKMGTGLGQRLEPWLDPAGTGTMYLDGMYVPAAPSADFDATNTYIQTGTPINFHDLSTNAPTSWEWTFEGGTPATSTEQNPTSVTYDQPGNYDVKLKVINALGNDTEIKSAYITVGGPNANYVADTTQGVAGDPIQFNDLTNPTPDSWLWKFGDGQTSTEQNPAHIYETAGEFTVTLIASNQYGTDSLARYRYIKIFSAPVIEFKASNTSIPSSSSINFTDQSTFDPFEWEWTFEGGDPATSTEQNPSNIAYAERGLYNVTLKATNQYGSNELTKEAFIKVGTPTANFDADFKELTQGAAINFTDLSTEEPTSWYWEFEGAEPATSTDQNPQNIVYNEIGSYKVSLTVANEIGENAAVRRNYITVSEGIAPTAGFEAESTTIIVGESVNFNDDSEGFPNSWNWTFEGGTPATSSEKNPQNIVYSEAGTFNVSLQVSNAYGDDEILKESYITVNTVGISEASEENLISINPNPGRGLFYITTAEAISPDYVLRVFDATGKEIQSIKASKSGETSIELDMNNFRAGTYLIRLNNNEEVLQQKLTIIE